eukprot:5320754-Prymnesium_polylepis.1
MPSGQVQGDRSYATAGCPSGSSCTVPLAETPSAVAAAYLKEVRFAKVPGSVTKVMTTPLTISAPADRTAPSSSSRPCVGRLRIETVWVEAPRVMFAAVPGLKVRTMGASPVALLLSP